MPGRWGGPRLGSRGGREQEEAARARRVYERLRREEELPRERRPLAPLSQDAAAARPAGVVRYHVGELRPVAARWRQLEEA